MREPIRKYEQNCEWDPNNQKISQTSFPDWSEVLESLILVNFLENNRWADGNQQEDTPPNIFKLFLLVI